ncbi:MAG TPA: hypothetical protein VF773_10675 [Verrucomicrobiae bacterium]
MKIAANIAGALLGLLFIMSGVVVLFKLAPMPPPPPADTPPGAFFLAFGTTGYLTFVKVLEVIGGVLVAIPKTRRAGLLVLGPIIINILAFHGFVTAGEGLFSPMLMAIVAVTLFLVWVERAAFAAFLLGPCHSVPVQPIASEPVAVTR